MVALLKEHGYKNIITRTRRELNLRDRGQVRMFFTAVQPEYVFLMAGHVGGIVANAGLPVDFLEQNAQMALNVIEASADWSVKKLVYTSSACAYPKRAENPIKEDSLLTGPMEPTNRPYALAKILGMELCKAYRQQYAKNFVVAMPTNLYGPGDHYDPITSHVLPGMVAKIHQAKLENAPSIALWGTGQPIREFLHSHDCARAHLYIMLKSEHDVTNIGGEKIRLVELADKIRRVVGYEGVLIWDSTKPDGTPDRQLDNSRMSRIGFSTMHTLDEALPSIYSDFLTQSNLT